MGKSKKVSAPPARDYAAEMRQALYAQAGIMGDRIGLERQFYPQIQAMKQSAMEAEMKGLQSLISSARPFSEQMSRDNIAFVKGEMPAITEAAVGQYDKALGASAGLLKTAEAQAANELALGGALTEEEERMGQQAARIAMSARGLTNGNQGIMQEVLNNYTLSKNREASRRDFASSVYGMRQGTTNAAIQAYGTPLFNLLSGANPMTMVGGAQGMLNQQMPYSFMPESSYNASLISANRKEAMDAQIANAQSSASRFGSIVGAVGTIAGAVVGGPMGAAMMGAQMSKNYGGGR